VSPSEENLLARLERVEARQAIGELPSRYAQAVDGRDLSALVELFVPDGDFGAWGKGRDGLIEFFEGTLRGFYRSMHQLLGHVIDFDSVDRARGTVYCRAEHEIGDSWVVMAICYYDTYVRTDRQWYFAQRAVRHWYAADMLSRPTGPDFNDWSGRDYKPALPHYFPKWSAFWASSSTVELRAITRHP
jgi:hypothetical protein